MNESRCRDFVEEEILRRRTGARPSLRRDIHFATVESNVSLSLPTTHGVDVMLRCLLCLEFKVIYCSLDLLVYILCNNAMWRPRQWKNIWQRILGFRSGLPKLVFCHEVVAEIYDFGVFFIISEHHDTPFLL
ncbi:hypothetical protein M758_UG103500 [Ceratodon purpureus]|nr:hypothetical protein M758_UG103500 [Ceratodon purpureus]